MKSETNQNNLTLGGLLSEAYPEFKTNNELLEMIDNLKEENFNLRSRNDDLLDQKEKMQHRLAALVNNRPEAFDWQMLAAFGFKVSAVKKLRDDCGKALSLYDAKMVVDDYVKRMGY